MSAKETIQQIEFEKFDKDDELFICQGIEIARLHRMNLTLFKNIITPHISTQNDEDQWTFDYESYLQAIAFGYESPIDWGRGFYRERWIKQELK